MTSEEIAAILGVGRGPAIGHLSRLRRNDLVGIANSRGVDLVDGETSRQLATRVVDTVYGRAKRDAQPKKRASRVRR
jgi:Mn-dependent DtxR family transcriptional regulator